MVQEGSQPNWGELVMVPGERDPAEGDAVEGAATSVSLYVCQTRGNVKYKTWSFIRPYGVEPFDKIL